MTASSQIPDSNEEPSSRRSVGHTSNLLLLGFVAGLLVENLAPAFRTVFTLGLTLTILCVSLAFSKLARFLRIQAERKARDRAVSELERRVERLIPQRRMIAHGMHSHRPHAREESESTWMPVARRSRTVHRRS